VLTEIERLSGGLRVETKVLEGESLTLLRVSFMAAPPVASSAGFEDAEDGSERRKVDAPFWWFCRLRPYPYSLVGCTGHAQSRWVIAR